MRRAARVLLAILAGSVSTMTACGTGAGSATDGPGRARDTDSGTELGGSITVSAASSLRTAFTEIGDGFEAAHPGVEVTFNFDASSALATQIIEGAPVDVFASADESSMSRLAADGLVAGEVDTFGGNELVVVTRPGNPAGIASVADLPNAGVISLCGEEVPCGRYAQAVLHAAGVDLPESRVTRGQSAAATLTAVAEGDAVAAIVYATDAGAAGDSVEVIELPAEHRALATYPIAVLRGSADRTLAEAFTAFVLGDAGRAVLGRHGFLPPP